MAAAANQIPELAVVPKDKNGNDSMSLSEIGLDGYIRIARMGGRIRFSEIDVVKVVTGKNNNHAAETIRDLSQEVQNEVNDSAVTFKFKGRGQQDTTLITYTGVIKLIMALPGKNAKALRTKFASVLLRFFAGDTSLMAEIEQNKESTNPINETAREALDEETGDAGVGDKRKTPDEVEYITKEQLRGYINEIHNQFKNQRRLTLGDERREVNKKKKEAEIEKKKLEDIAKIETKKLEDAAKIEKKKLEDAEKVRLQARQEEIDMDLKKQETEYRILEKRLPLLKQHDEIEKAKFEREMLRLEKQIQLKTATPATQVPALPPMPSGPFTARLVGDFYGIFKDVSTKFVIRISNSAMKNIMTHPHNIEPIGWVEDKLIGKRHAHFRSEDVPLLKKVLENCKMDEEKYENIKAAPQDIISSA